MSMLTFEKKKRAQKSSVMHKNINERTIRNKDSIAHGHKPYHNNNGITMLTYSAIITVLSNGVIQLTVDGQVLQTPW